MEASYPVPLTLKLKNGQERSTGLTGRHSGSERMFNDVWCTSGVIVKLLSPCTSLHDFKKAVTECTHVFLLRNKKNKKAAYRLVLLFSSLHVWPQPGRELYTLCRVAYLPWQCCVLAALATFCNCRSEQCRGNRPKPGREF